MIRYDEAGMGRWSTSLWAGIGTVGSFAALYDPPAAGAELAVEKRFYFKPGAYKHFFISGYAGIAYMGYVKSMNFMGIVPGLKINYKAHLSGSFILEPYLGVSMPVPYDLEDRTILTPFPVATIGLRIGFSTLKRRPAKKENSLQS